MPTYAILQNVIFGGQVTPAVPAVQALALLSDREQFSVGLDDREQFSVVVADREQYSVLPGDVG